MSTRKRAVAPMRGLLRTALVACVAVGGAAAGAEGPGLGQPVAPATLAAIDIGIAPDGKGLPPGRGTAVDGASVFAAKCAACHGVGGENGLHDRLVGGQGSLTTDKPVKTVGSYWPYATTVFDYIRRTMPFQEPRSLADDEVYAVTAWLLWRNGVIGERTVMDAKSLPKVRMPNRDSFIWTADVPGQNRAPY
jgi:S-disulfanyl-L-cysteine oxidoreductase SoxD